MPASTIKIEERLWQMADRLRANTPLRAHEYAEPVLGLLFLKFAYESWKLAETEIKRTSSPCHPEPGPAMYSLVLPEEARYPWLLKTQDVAGAVIQAMELIEQWNQENLLGVLPKKSYGRLEKETLLDLMRGFDTLGLSDDLDIFGRVYEYFLDRFARSEGQRSGEFFTPASLVRLIVEVLEPFQGKILDPACGSGGMFVQSANFVRSHQRNGSLAARIYGQEKSPEALRLCKMNLAVHGLSGTVEQANSYYDDPFLAFGRFDYIMTNPPFNASGIDTARIISNRFPLGRPRVDNGNYLWINLFYSALNERGRAGFVMPNQACNAGNSEQEVRKKLIETGAVDAMIAIGPQFFYTVTLPCTLWFLDKGKQQSEYSDQVLFIDARNIYRQIDRAHRDFRTEDIEFIANIVRIYRGKQPETEHGSERRIKETFPGHVYADVPGLCKVATRAEIARLGWSLNPGRYVGVAERASIDFDFKEKLEELYEELEMLNAEARELEETTRRNIVSLLDHD